MAAMVLVNNPGDGEHSYWPLKHADWNGWTPTDLIFPSFVFMMGVAMMYALPARLARGVKEAVLIRQMFFRSLALFAFGLFVNGFPHFDLHTQRIPGVLQRFALCYFFAGLIYLFTRRETRTESGLVVRPNLPVIISVIFALLIGYWALLKFVPVPGYGVGRLDPEGNLGAYIDRALFAGHLWGASKTWDPEGLLSTLPAIGTTLLGMLCGTWVRSTRTPERKALGMVIAGIVLMTIAQLLHPVFPINKKLWTSTFVLLAGGFTSLCFGICYWIVDIKRLHKWAVPAFVFGTNAILAYVVSEVIEPIEGLIHIHTGDGTVTLHTWIYDHFFVSWLSPYNASLAYAICFIIVVWLIVMPFYRKRIFLRL